MSFSDKEIKVADIKKERRQYGKNKDVDFGKIIIDIGRSSHAAPNHIVASITERSTLHGSDIGKIEIYDDHSVISIPSESIEEVIDMMYGAKVCGKPVKTRVFEEKPDYMRTRQKNRSFHEKGRSFKSHSGKNTSQKNSRRSYGSRRKG